MSTGRCFRAHSPRHRRRRYSRWYRRERPPSPSGLKHRAASGVWNSSPSSKRQRKPAGWMPMVRRQLWDWSISAQAVKLPLYRRDAPQHRPASSVAMWSQRMTKGLCWWLEAPRTLSTLIFPWVRGVRSTMRSMVWRPQKWIRSSPRPSGKSRQAERAASSSTAPPVRFTTRAERAMASYSGNRE